MVLAAAFGSIAQGPVACFLFSSEQLALGLRIVSNAYKSRVQGLDNEIRVLKAQNAERGEQVCLPNLLQRCRRGETSFGVHEMITCIRLHLRSVRIQVAVLQKKCSALEVQLIEQTQRGNQLVEENKQLLATTRKVRSTLESMAFSLFSKACPPIQSISACN